MLSFYFCDVYFLTDSIECASALPVLSNFVNTPSLPFKDKYVLKQFS